MNSIFILIIIIISLIARELGRGYFAKFLGDDTGERSGRLGGSLWSHVDLVGTIIIPAISFLSAHIFIGWTKPIPYNPYNFKNQKIGERLMAFSGVITSICIILSLSVLFRISQNLALFSQTFFDVFSLAILINIALTVFSLLPLPGFEGFSIIKSFASTKLKRNMFELEMNPYVNILAIILFISFFGSKLQGVINSIFSLLI